jgi:hypothetical protein
MKAPLRPPVAEAATAPPFLTASVKRARAKTELGAPHHGQAYGLEDGGYEVADLRGGGHAEVNGAEGDPQLLCHLPPHQLAQPCDLDGGALDGVVEGPHVCVWQIPHDRLDDPGAAYCDVHHGVWEAETVVCAGHEWDVFRQVGGDGEARRRVGPHGEDDLGGLLDCV